jgi:DNA-nicking Smr family endonuclease
MTGPRRTRRPTAEERALWEAVAKTVKPLRPRRQANTTDVPPPTPAKAMPAAVGSVPRPTAPARPVEPPQLAPLDRRMRTRIGRGSIAIDARVDLHGLTQAAAHQRLRTFLADSQAAGAKLVLVITGKGRTGDTHSIGTERGVLRRLVPIWLGSTELRRYVVGYDTAGRGHGGEGALYVRLRSQRKGSG